MGNTGLVPGPHVRTHDDSFFSSSPGRLHTANYVTASWGPVNTKTESISPSGLVTNFGKPGNTSMYAAMAMVRSPMTLHTVRITDGSDAKSSVDILSGVTSILKAEAKYTGTTGDEIQVKVASPSDGNVAKINLEIYIYGTIEKVLPNVSSFVDAASRTSDYITLEEAAGSPTWPADWSGEYDTTYDLSGGADGDATPDMSSYLTGAVATGPVDATGLHMFDDIANDVVDILTTPGWSSASVVNAGLQTARIRDDSIYAVDAPDNLSMTDLKAWHNGSYGGGPTLPLNSEFGALCYPWLNYYDEYSQSTVSIPPSAAFAIAVANTWKDETNPYMSPANYNSAKMPEYITGLRYNPSPDMIVETYDTDGQNIDWFKNWVGYGITLWGQKTLYRTNSALNRLNVMFTMNQIKRRVKTDTRGFTFRNNEPGQQASLKAFIESILDPIIGLGISEYKVKCDEDLNTAEVKQENKMMTRVFVKPLISAEWLFFDLYVTSQGAVL